MPTTRRSKKSSTVPKIQTNDMQTPTELDMLAAVATSVHLENEQAEQEQKQQQKSKRRKSSGAERSKGGYKEEVISEIPPEPDPMQLLNSIGPKPKNLEMTQSLLDSLMFPIKVRNGTSLDEIFITVPMDSNDETEFIKAVVIGNKKIKIMGSDEEYSLTNVDGYVEYCLSSLTEENLSLSELFSPKTNNKMYCQEKFDDIAGKLGLQTWLDGLTDDQETVSFLREHDYFQHFLKFGRPETSNYVETIVAAYNKYKNFIDLSCPSLFGDNSPPNYLFGLWWEKEEPSVDFWLLPKPVDQPDNTYHGLPENHWSGNVVVAREELICHEDDFGNVVPFVDLLDTPADTRRYDQQISWEDTKKAMQTYEDEHEKAIYAIQSIKADHSSAAVAATSAKARKITRAGGPVRTIVVKKSSKAAAPRMQHGMEEEEDETATYQKPNALRMQVAAINASAVAAAATDKNRKLSREKIEEMDFAMRCIKEIQNHRYRGYYPLRCKICQREFTAPTSLIVHYRSHAGIKPFTCSVCLASFTRRHSLKYHMLCHSGQSRFRCNICARLFRHSGHFRDHLRKHELGTPFSCEMCGSEFGTRTSYRRHMLLTHDTTLSSNQNRKDHSAAAASTSRGREESFSAVHNLLTKSSSRSSAATYRTGVGARYDEESNVLIEELVDHQIDDESLNVNVVPGLLVIPSGSGATKTLVVQKGTRVII